MKDGHECCVCRSVVRCVRVWARVCVISSDTLTQWVCNNLICNACFSRGKLHLTLSNRSRQ